MKVLLTFTGFHDPFSPTVVEKRNQAGPILSLAVAMYDLLIRANWVKRVLFICDRLELRKQAHNVFKEYLEQVPRVYVGRTTAEDRAKRLYLATYPAMMKCFETFDVGFFDLIIADESHRSIY